MQPTYSGVRREGVSRIKNLAARRVSTACFILYIFFVLDFFLRFSQRIPGYGALRPTLLLFLLVAGVLFLNREKISDRFQDPIFRSFFILSGYIVFSLPFVEWPGSVLRSNLNDFVLSVSFLFFTALIIDTDKRLKAFLLVFVGCQVFRVIEPLYLHLTQGYWGSKTHLGNGNFAERLAGAPADVINPNELGFVIVTAIPFLHYLLWTREWKSKLIYLLLMPALLYALMLTMSRGAFVALLVVGFMIFKESQHKLGLLTVGLIVAVIGWSIMTPLQQERYLSLVDEDAQGGASVQGRLGGMEQEFALGMRRPIVGHGLGTTSEAKFHAFGSTQASHNLYAEIIIELGIIGAIIFLRFLLKIYQRLSDNRRKFEALSGPDDRFYANLNQALIALFWMYVVYSINYWGLSQYYWYLFGGLCIAFGCLLDFSYRNSQDSYESINQTDNECKYPLARKYNKSERARIG